MDRNVAELKENIFNRNIYGEEELPKAFIESVKEHGILEPLVIKEDRTIISGHRRWQAAKLLGMETVPVRIVSYDNELDEREAVVTFNKQRVKTASQRQREADELVAIESERAKQRQVSQLKQGERVPVRATLPEREKGRTRDKVAEKVGMKPRTFDKERAVYKAAKAGNETAKSLLKNLDKGTITVHSAYKKLNHKPAEEPPPLPTGKYNVIYADPPWRYEFSETSMRAIENQYPTMDLEDIKQLKIPVADNAVLLLWATAPKLEEALSVLNSWGFTYKTCAVWDKEKVGMGYWFRGQHELLLLGVKGNFNAPEEQNRFSSVIRQPRSKHSKKPEQVYEMIERMFPHGQYIELFAREQRGGWGGWGNES